MNTPLLRFDVPLAAYTTFGIGGQALLFTDVHSSEQLLEAVTWADEQDLPHVVLGRGSNVLVDDTGIEGLVIRNARSDRVELLPGDRVHADSGVEIERLIAFTIERGLSGLEHFAGVPATLGGAIRQNLHFLSPDRSRLTFIGDLVEEATVVADGAVAGVNREWFCFGSDAATLGDGDAVVLDATLQLAAADPVTLRATMEANLAWRATRHPVRAATRSAGCVFRNPADSAAARAIDAAGLKGRRVGGAVVSRRHANFILNTGGATASDVRTLLDLVSRRVADHSGLRLTPELAFLGTASHGPGADGSDCARKENRSAVHLPVPWWRTMLVDMLDEVGGRSPHDARGESGVAGPRRGPDA